MTHQSKMRLTDLASVDVTVERMGVGGFAVVYMGPDSANGGQWTALKTLRPELLALRPQLRDLFVSEGLTWVGLWPHPNLLTCEGATEINGHVYLVLAYAAGGSLRDLLPLSPPFADRFAWAQHIAAGLVALHAPDPDPEIRLLRPQSLVHRDLKPENVLVRQSGLAQITDFGLAAAVSDALAASPEGERAFALIEKLAAQDAQSQKATPAPLATRSIRFRTRGAAGARGGVGTIEYMPPEQWLTGGEVGPAADMYAFGLILSELLAGRHGLADLEERRSEEDWRRLHTHGTPRPLRTGPAEGATRLPVEMETLYTELLAKRPADRPTAEQALSRLQQAAQALGEAPYTPAPDAYPRDERHRMEFWHSCAITCTRFARYDEALAHNERALALVPDEFMVWNNRGNILSALGRRARRAGDDEQALRLLEKGLAADTRALALVGDDRERAAAHGGRARQLSDLGRHAEAEAAYAAALALNPNDGSAWFNRAANTLKWARAEVAAGHATETAHILAAGEGYVSEARHCGYNSPELPRLLADIQQARAQLKP